MVRLVLRVAHEASGHLVVHFLLIFASQPTTCGEMVVEPKESIQLNNQLDPYLNSTILLFRCWTSLGVQSFSMDPKVPEQSYYGNMARLHQSRSSKSTDWHGKTNTLISSSK